MGSQADYKAMYAHLETLAQDPTVGQGWIRVAYIETPYFMMNSDPYLPADTSYDILAPDVYNFYHYDSSYDHVNGDCPTGTAGCTWHMPSTSNLFGTTQTVSPYSTTNGLVNFAKTHQKHILAAEMGSHPGCPGGWNSLDNPTASTPINVDNARCSSTDSSPTRDAWFQDLAEKLTDPVHYPDYATWIEGFIYFHDADLHDYQFTNRTNNTVNYESSVANKCTPTTPGVYNAYTCFDGNYNSADSDPLGWGVFVTDQSAYNNNQSNWFIGSTEYTDWSGRAAFMP